MNKIKFLENIMLILFCVIVALILCSLTANASLDSAKPIIELSGQKCICDLDCPENHFCVSVDSSRDLQSLAISNGWTGKPECVQRMMQVGTGEDKEVKPLKPLIGTPICEVEDKNSDACFGLLDSCKDSLDKCVGKEPEVIIQYVNVTSQEEDNNESEYLVIIVILSISFLISLVFMAIKTRPKKEMVFVKPKFGANDFYECPQCHLRRKAIEVFNQIQKGKK